jgi:predicted ABC-type exoprotein transport system permease subunit
MDRCYYCGKKRANQKTGVKMWLDSKLKTTELNYCSEDCKQNIHIFVSRYNKVAPFFAWLALTWLGLLIGLPLILQVTTHNPIYLQVIPPIVLALLGLVLIPFPLGIVTPRYYERLGVRNTTWFIRLTGVFMLFTGVAMLWLMK